MRTILASADNPVEHVLDQPWVIGGKVVPWMSSQIATMLLVAVLLAAVLPWMMRSARQARPGKTYWFVELLVSFVRSHIVRPTLGGNDAYVPFFATMLCFLLGCNLAGLLPLRGLSELAGLHNTPIGGTPTGSIFVCGAMAGMTLVMVFLLSYWHCVVRLWRGSEERAHVPRAGLNVPLAISNALQRRRWPLPVAAVGGVFVWLNGFVPPLPGLLGLVLWPLLLVLELIGNLSRCFALAIRLFANMTAGHLLLVVVVGIAAAGRGAAIAYVSTPSALGCVALMLLETLVATIQAYLFTFLSALFVALAVHPQH